MIRVFEAFAGIGGFRSALEKTGGFEIVGWCEINHFAQKAYRLLFDVKRHVKHKKRENPKKAVKKQNTPYKLRIYGVYEV